MGFDSPCNASRLGGPAGDRERARGSAGLVPPPRARGPSDRRIDQHGQERRIVMMRAQMFMYGLQKAGTRFGPFLKVTIYEFQRGLLYRRGRFERGLEPGRYWLRARDTFVQAVDARPAFVTVPGQEVLTADG